MLQQNAPAPWGGLSDVKVAALLHAWHLVVAWDGAQLVDSLDGAAVALRWGGAFLLFRLSPYAWHSPKQWSPHTPLRPHSAYPCVVAREPFKGDPRLSQPLSPLPPHTQHGLHVWWGAVWGGGVHTSVWSPLSPIKVTSLWLGPKVPWKCSVSVCTLLNLAGLRRGGGGVTLERASCAGARGALARRTAGCGAAAAAVGTSGHRPASAHCVGYSIVPPGLASCRSNSWRGAISPTAAKSRSSRLV